MNRCENCGKSIFFGGINIDKIHFCNSICLEAYNYPYFCQRCLSNSSDESAGSCYRINGCGTSLYFEESICPTCKSIVKTKYFSLLFIPIIPLGKYRIKYVANKKYYSRKVQVSSDDTKYRPNVVEELKHMEQLPQEIDCPYCKTTLELNSKEQKEKTFICAECKKLVDLS